MRPTWLRETSSPALRVEESLLPLPVMADPSRDRFSPFGVSLFAVAIVILVLAAFLMMQRGGEVTGDPGADGINPVPEQMEASE